MATQRSVTTVGIIGSAGRKADAKKMSKAIFYAMMSKAEEVITRHFKLDLGKVRLISGGAAWADHIAVMEYIEAKVLGLTLHLPSPWQQHDSDPQFLDNEAQNIYRNPGRSANKLHRQFSGKIGEDTLKQIQSAIYLGAQYHVHNGFKERNTAVAHQSEYLVAFTWNNGKTPKEESGTFDTWKKHQGTKKIHIPIGSLSCVAGGSKLLTSFLEPQSSAAVEHTVEHTVGRTDSIDSGCCSSGSASESFSQSSESQELEKVSIGLKRESPSGASTETKKPKLVNKHQSL